MKEKVMEHPSGLVLPIELARKIQREGVSAIPDEILEQCDLWQAQALLELAGYFPRNPIFRN